MTLDADELAQRASVAAQSWAPGATISDVKPLPRGSSSLTYVAAVANAPIDRLVLKVAFPGAPPIKNRDVLRQARVLTALAAAPGVEVPEVFFGDVGAPVEVPPFFGMSFISGESFDPNLDDDDPGSVASDIHERAIAAARMLAALHNVDLTACSFADEPVVTPADEVDRWTATFASVQPDLQGNYEELASRLRNGLPAPVAPAVVHGDWRLGNLLCDGPAVCAAIDWEIWAVSDPRVDLSWFLLTADPEVHPTAVRHHPGMPDSATLLANYEEAVGHATADLAWFRALTLYKMGAVSALIAKHRRRVDDPLGDVVAGRVPLMLERAGALVG